MPIFHKYYAFLKALASWQIQCPKAHLHTIGVTVVSKSHKILELLYRANVTRTYKRLTILNETSLEHDLLKIFIRLAKDTNAMTDKHYIRLQGLLNESGKMLGGWIKDQSGETKRPADSGNVRET